MLGLVHLINFFFILCMVFVFCFLIFILLEVTANFIATR